MRPSFAIPPFAILGAAVALAGCGPEPQLYVSDAWVRLPAVEGRPAAAYFTVHGGPEAETLVAVTSDRAIRSELHETRRTTNGAMTMAKIDAVPVPAMQQVAFAPGGKHVMLFGLNKAVTPGSATTMTFTFADATRIQLDATAVAAGDPAPK
jgi:copper(I)-binding protein